MNIKMKTVYKHQNKKYTKNKHDNKYKKSRMKVKIK